ncbi:MAG: hypothetical protein Q9182_004775 [Xanthomendoza sp. 2 TL-2023]
MDSELLTVVSQSSDEDGAASSATDPEVDDCSEPDDIKLSLDQALSQFKTFGSFATSGNVSGDVSTGLSIQGLGRIAFPLIEYQAKQLVQACHRAPFGKGSQTIVDQNVRKTWELNPDQFELLNPAWPLVIDNLTKTISKELGCAPEVSVKANLYKLLLYEQGAFFKPHKDTEKEPGMFATLVVCLPSEFEGGAVVTKHCGKTRVFESHSSFHHSYISWYADVTHEVQPIISGYRIALVYNVINNTPGNEQSASLAIAQKQKLSNMLCGWHRAANIEGMSAPEALVYQLDHQYTDAHLKLQALKGLDRVKAEYLKETCENADICFYLGSMEYRKEGSAEDDSYGRRYKRRHYDNSDGDEDASSGIHALEDILEEQLTLKRIIDLDGNILAMDLELDDEDLIVQEGAFEREPDHEDYEGYTGNAGATATHWFHDTVIVLIPLQYREKFFKDLWPKGRVNINDWMRRLMQVVQADSPSDFSRKDLIELSCSLVRQKPMTTQERNRNFLGKAPFEASDPDLRISASVVLKDQQLFEEVLSTFSATSLPVFRDIGTAMAHFNFLTIPAVIDALLNRVSTFHGRVQAVEKVKEGFKLALEVQNPRNDARLADLHQVRYELDLTPGSQLTFDSLVSLAKRFESNTAFLVALANRIFEAKKEKKIDEPQADVTFRELLDVVTPKFKVECRKSVKRSRPGAQQGSDPVECLLIAEHVDQLLHHLVDDIDSMHRKTIIDKLMSEAELCDLIAFETFYFPFLAKLLGRVKESHDRGPAHQQIVLKVLESYIQRYVQPEPLQTGNMTRSQQGCTRCADCKALDIFLLDPRLKTWRFPVSRSRRAHLHQMLEGTSNSHVTDRSGLETLVVTKGADATTAKHNEWKKRCEIAKTQIRGLDQGNLRLLLGQEEYKHITQLRATKKASTNQTIAQLNRGQRHPVEIIDLT